MIFRQRLTKINAKGLPCSQSVCVSLKRIVKNLSRSVKFSDGSGSWVVENAS